MAETLKVLKLVVAEDHKTHIHEENTASHIKQGRKMVKEAMDRYVSKLEKDMGQNLDKDNRSELNNAFQIYQKLD